MENENQEKATKKSKKQVNFLKYTSMATQMGFTIGLFVFMGIKLDAWLETKALFTLVLSLSGVGLSLYMFIRQVIQENE